MDNRGLLKRIRLFRKKANTDKLIIFVGAGVSRNVAGMPDWNTLIQQMAGAINYSRCDNCKKKSIDALTHRSLFDSSLGNDSICCRIHNFLCFLEKKWSTVM